MLSAGLASDKLFHDRSTEETRPLDHGPNLSECGLIRAAFGCSAFTRFYRGSPWNLGSFNRGNTIHFLQRIYRVVVFCRVARKNLTTPVRAGP